MAVSMTMTPFMALRRALRRLPSRRPALAAGAGVPPRFAGLATILEKMRLALPGGNSAGSTSSPADARRPPCPVDRRRRAAAKAGCGAGTPVNLTTARLRGSWGRS